MTVSLVAHTILNPPSFTGGTTTAIDTTGANLIVLPTSGYAPLQGGEGVSDSYGNTWTKGSLYRHDSGDRICYSVIWYCENPTVGSGHTFTWTGGTLENGTVLAFSGAYTGGTQFDKQSGDNSLSATATGVTAPSITATNANSIFVAVAAWNGAGTASIDSSFTIVDQHAPYTNVLGVAAAWKQSTTESPTWTASSSSDDMTTAMMVFRAAAGGGATTHPSSGALVGPGSVVVGSAVHKTKHTSSGTLVGAGAVIVGSAKRFRRHPSSGVLTGPGSTLAGSANHGTGPITHATSGALVGPGAAVVGSARRFRKHPSSGALVGSGSTVVGSARRFRQHPSSGVLAGSGAAIVGSAARTAHEPSTHATTGVLVGSGSMMSGAGKIPAHWRPVGPASSDWTPAAPTSTSWTVQ